MPYAKKARVFNSAIGEVVLGEGDSAVAIGGSNVLPLHFFDAPAKNAPAVGIEITDTDFDATELPLLGEFYAGAETISEKAKRAASAPGVSFVCLRFEGADPGGLNRSASDCAVIALEAANAVNAMKKPLVISGCKNMEKDMELFTALAETLSGRNVLFLSAREEDYKGIAAATALAYGHVTGAESAVDINLAKQLNVLMTQLGVKNSSIAMNLGSAAAGYGFEYVSSTMDRVKSAALEQSDAMLQMPVITPVSQEAWSVKEALMSESDMPEWGSREQRGIQMEVVTASACLASGSDAVILRHPVSVTKTAALIAALM